MTNSPFLPAFKTALQEKETDQEDATLALNGQSILSYDGFASLVDFVAGGLGSCSGAPALRPEAAPAWPTKTHRRAEGFASHRRPAALCTNFPNNCSEKAHICSEKPAPVADIPHPACPSKNPRYASHPATSPRFTPVRHFRTSAPIHRTPVRDSSPPVRESRVSVIWVTARQHPATHLRGTSAHLFLSPAHPCGNPATLPFAPAGVS